MESMIHMIDEVNRLGLTDIWAAEEYGVDVPRARRSGTNSSNLGNQKQAWSNAGGIPGNRNYGGLGTYFGGRPQNQSRRQRCRDFNDYGYCRRAEQCPYEHVIDQSQTEARMLTGHGYDNAGRQLYNAGVEPLQGGSYGNASDAAPSFYGMRGFTGNLSSATNEHFPRSVEHQQGYGLQRGGRGRGPGRGITRNAGYQPYPARPKVDSIIVNNIPDECNNMESVNRFFSKFGNIVNIRMEPQLKQAIIQFSSPEEANRAHKSPEPVFSNRFVKVFYHNPEKPQERSVGGVKPPEVNVGQSQLQSLRLRPTGFQALTSPGPLNLQTPLVHKKAVPEADNKSLIQKQIEFKKQILEKLERKDLSSKERALLLEAWKTTESSARATLSNAVSAGATVKARVPVNMTPEEREKARLDRELDMINQIQDPDGGPSANDTNAALLAHLESLKVEALRVGVDPAIALRQPSSGATRWNAKSRPSVFNLDNRTTKLLVSNVPAGSSHFGEVIAFDLDETLGRMEAEKV
ncbi:hypothetical protein BC829DRAFT_393078 [Chytridium lagenaria]|nr:hypothetical protein BC829DRAFT_393078 [Chytridium lagenaria]